MKRIYFFFASKTTFQLLQNIHVLLSNWYMPAGSLAVPSHNAVSKQTSMLVCIRTVGDYSTFKKWYWTSKRRRSQVYLDKCSFTFFTKKWIQPLEKKQKMSFGISCCYYWHVLYLLKHRLSCLFLISLSTLFAHFYKYLLYRFRKLVHKLGLADAFKTRTMLIFLTIFLNKCRKQQVDKGKWKFHT